MTAGERRSDPHAVAPFGRRASDRVDLTARQREVLEGVSRGLENKEIAGQLGISEQAVKQQVSVLLKKFGVASRAMLARQAVTMTIIGHGSRSSDAPLEYFFDRAPILMGFTKGPGHEIRLVNREFRRIFGGGEYVGRTVRECLPEEAGALVSILDRVYQSGWPWRESEQRLSFDAPDGSKRVTFLSWVAEPVRDATNAIEGIAFYAWDVTAQVGARAQLERAVDVREGGVVERSPTPGPPAPQTAPDTSLEAVVTAAARRGPRSPAGGHAR